MIITSNSCEAADIMAYLKDKLNLPENLISFSVHFTIDQPIRVTCEYLPESRDDSNKST